MIIGIDNGLDGAIAVIDRSGKIHETMVMPSTKGPRGRGESENIVDARIVTELFTRYLSAHSICIERPAGSQNVNAVQSMADSFATVRTISLCMGFKTDVTTAYRWQRTFWPAPPRQKKNGPPVVKIDSKAQALKAATAIWPDYDFRKTSRCTKDHDGIVDALLIAEHFRRLLPTDPFADFK